MKTLKSPVQPTLHVVPDNNLAFRQQNLDLFYEHTWLTDYREEYKYTPLERYIQKTAWHHPSKIKHVPHLSHYLLPNNPYTALFINGTFYPNLSNLPNLPGVTLAPLSQLDLAEKNRANHQPDPYELLNAAYWNDGLSITLSDNTILHHPLIIVHINDNDSNHTATQQTTRVHVRLSPGSSASIVEQYSNASGPFFQNSSTEIELEENAHLLYGIIQNAPQSVHVNNVNIYQQSRSKLDTYTITLEGDLIRNNLSIHIEGSESESHFRGLYIINNHTIADNHTLVNHCRPNSISNEVYKGIMDQQSKGIFNGKIQVQPHAQKTSAYQSNRNILLTDNAVIHTKPQLEIFADDVKCSHGCTTGKLNEEALFYLRTRGISMSDARSMLIHAFVTDVIDPLKEMDLKKHIHNLVSQKINALHL